MIITHDELKDGPQIIRLLVKSRWPTTTKTRNVTSVRQHQMIQRRENAAEASQLRTVVGRLGYVFAWPG